MARKGKNDPDKGRNFYETSSPFETYRPGASKPKSYSGIIDRTVEPSKNLRDTIPGTRVLSQEQAQQYDNPRGYPGLALIQTGDQKPKLPFGKHEHAIFHALEGEAGLARTGKSGGK